MYHYCGAKLDVLCYIISPQRWLLDGKNSKFIEEKACDGNCGWHGIIAFSM